MTIILPGGSKGVASKAFTLTEVVISTMIAAVTAGSVIYGYVFSAKQAEWASYSLAAQALAMQRIEQARSCKWDMQASPNVDELIPAEFPMQTNILDIPIVNSNQVTMATNFTSITTISVSPPLKMIRVDCVWSFIDKEKLFTNTIVTYRSPDS